MPFGIALTEDHWFVRHVPDGRKIFCPVVTWTTRSSVRRRSTRIFCPLMEHVWLNQSVLRIAVHPTDFKYPKVVDNIKRVLEKALERRRAVGYRDLAFTPQEKD